MRTGWIDTAKADGVLTVTINRPDKLNAFTGDMGQDLADVFETASEDDDVRAIVVTGAGRAFCAGADISDGAGAFGEGAAKTFGSGSTSREDNRFVDAMYRCLKPSIAAINGPAIGLGITLTLPLDIRIAAETAKFGFVFSRRGLVPEAGATWFLPRIVGMAQAMRWCYSGEVFDAKEALRGGLVSEVTAAETVLERAQEIAREIARESSPVAVALMRQMFLRLGNQTDPGPVLDVDSTINRQLGASKDVSEGVTAFFEKRSPVFPGKVSTDMPPAWRGWQD